LEQWAVVGDTFPVGCAPAEDAIVFPESFKHYVLQDCHSFRIMGQFLPASRELPDAAPISAGQLDEDLRLFLLGSLPHSESELLELGFEPCTDHPQCPGHCYLEGYFHACAATSLDEAAVAPVSSVHPRCGSELRRPAAPAPLHAFCELFRRKNEKVFRDLQAELVRSATAAPLGSVLERQAHFADLSVQIHWGDEIPSDHVAWHVDASNSFLHMAIGLQGQRALHVRRHVNRSRVSQNCAIGASDDREVLPQGPGSVYVASPCCFPHAVQYEETGWSNRIVAVQCRLLLTEEEIFGTLNGKQHTALDIDPQGGTAAIVFRHLESLASHGLALPTLDEVQAFVRAKH